MVVFNEDQKSTRGTKLWFTTQSASDESHLSKRLLSLDDNTGRRRGDIGPNTNHGNEYHSVRAPDQSEVFFKSKKVYSDS